MKRLFTALFALVLTTTMALAQQTTLWDSQTFTAFPIVSADIDNSSNTKNAIKVFIVYEDFTPDFATPGLRAVLEEEIAPDVWRIIAAQNEFAASELIAPQRTIVLEPTFVADPGVDLFIDDGEGGQRISMFDGTPGRTLRVRIIGNGSAFSSVTLSAYVELFDR